MIPKPHGINRFLYTNPTKIATLTAASHSIRASRSFYSVYIPHFCLKARKNVFSQSSTLVSTSGFDLGSIYPSKNLFLNSGLMHSRSYSREIDRNDHTSYNNQDNQNYLGEENHTGTPDSILETDTTIDQIPYDILSAENIQAIDNSTPFIFELTQALLEKLHEGFAIFGLNITGLPWWAAIFCSAIVLRGSATLPISIFQQRAIARTKKLEPVLKSWSNALKSFAQIEAKSRRLNDAEFKKLFYKMYRKKSNELYLKNKCHPAYSMVLPLVQIPLWIVLSLTIRGMTGNSSLLMLGGVSGVATQTTLQELSTGGTLWFENLLHTDPTFILPASVVLLYLYNFEANQRYNRTLVGQRSKIQNIMVHVFRGVCLLMIPISINAPVALNLYWLASALFSFFQTTLFHYEPFRRAMSFYTPDKKP